MLTDTMCAPAVGADRRHTPAAHPARGGGGKSVRSRRGGTSMYRPSGRTFGRIRDSIEGPELGASQGRRWHVAE